MSYGIRFFVLALALSACTPDGGPPEPEPTTTTTTAPAEPPPPPPLVCEATQRTTTRAFAGERIERAQERIVGGIEARPGAWPWAAAITEPQRDGSLFQYCGGALIHADWVLTAAHCEVRSGDVIVLGRHDLDSTDGEEIPVDFVLEHERWNDETMDNDIALAHLSRPSKQSSIVVGTWSGTAPLPGWTVRAIGWGATREGGSTSPVLMQVDVEVYTDEMCRESYDGITDSMLCAGIPDGGRDSCQGDSGGPLMIEHNGAWDHVGITSWGQGCARPGLPGVYTDVARFRQWIEACAL